MNKKLFLKLGLLLLSLSLIACGQKNNLSEADNSYKSNTTQFVSNTQSSVTESAKTKAPTVKNAVENKQKDEDKQKNTQQEISKKKYYDLIKEAWQKQKDYIDSIDDPKVKQSVQTTHSAAISKSTELLTAYPEDSKVINESLKKVLASEDIR